MDQRGDDVRLVLGDQLHQMPPRFGTIRRQAAGGESVAQLLVEIDPVGDQHDARRADIEIQHQRLGQHHHRQRLAGALGVPDDTAAPTKLPSPACGRGCPKGAGEGRFHLLYPSQNALHREELLVAGNLAPSAIEYREQQRHAQQTLGPAQGVNRAVLLGQCPAYQVFGIGFAHAETFGQQLIQSCLRFLRQGLVQHRAQGRAVLVFLFLLLAPHRPIFRRRAHGGVFTVVLVGADHQLCIGKQCRDVLVALVADHLRHRLRHLGVGRFALDHRERDAIDEQHDIRPCRFVAAGAFHREFSGDVIGVVLRVFPVDVVEGEAAHRPLH